MSLNPPPPVSVSLSGAAGSAFYSIQESEDKATLLVVDYQNVSLPLIWSGNRLRTLDGTSPVPEFMALPVAAIAQALAILPPQ